MRNRKCTFGNTLDAWEYWKKHKKRLREFETYSKLSFLKQYDSNEYIKRFVVTEDDPVADFFQDNESNRVNVLPHDRSKLQKFIAMHLPHNNTGLFYLSFQDKSVQPYSRVTRPIKTMSQTIKRVKCSLRDWIKQLCCLGFSISSIWLSSCWIVKERSKTSNNGVWKQALQRWHPR